MRAVPQPDPSQRVSLAPQHLRARSAVASSDALPAPLLATAGPTAMLGGSAAPDGLAVPIVPGPATLFGPRGTCLAAPGGPLFVCDTGHHRLMIWRQAPEADDVPADAVIGQPDFCREGRNANGDIGPQTLNVPTGLATAAGVLALADAWNHRVLLWHGLPTASGRPADLVLGQADFGSGFANRGLAAPRADTLHWCYGVAIAEGRLIVADTGNRRVLVWDRIPERHGEPADLVLSQRDCVTRDENAGEGAGARGNRWPHGIIAVAEGLLCMADAGNNRIMAWRGGPVRDGAPCDFVLGQADPFGLDHNRGSYAPAAGALKMPYGLCTQNQQLIVADTANSRLVGFARPGLDAGIAADRLAGQGSFQHKGDNRWGAVARDSLCWPYGVAAAGHRVAVADSGNNRVLLWEAAA